MSPALLAAGIDAAHAHDRPAIGHLEDVPWTDALAMGLDAIVHLMPISPDLLAPDQRRAYSSARGLTDGGAGDRLGRIGAGREADLVVVEEDPLADLGHLRDAYAVVLDGRYLDRAALATLRGDE